MEFIISLVICIVAALAVYYFFDRSSSSSTVTVTSGQDGKVATDFSNVISVSENQGQLTFSYAGWIEVDDFTYRLGERKVIFSKGSDDMTSSCPALVIDANTNSLLVILDTYGTQEIVPISNIPAKKWIHFAIVVDQTSINIYTKKNFTQLFFTNSKQLYTTLQDFTQLYTTLHNFTTTLQNFTRLYKT